MNKCLIKIQKNSLEVRIFLSQRVNLFRGWDFKLLTESEYLNTLVEMLPEKIHHVGCFMFGEGTLKFFLIVDLYFGCLGFLLWFTSAFVFLWA